MMESSESEKNMGMEVYFTDTPGIGGKLRKSPEDFLVEEISIPVPENEVGKFTIAKIRVRNWETNRLIRQLSRSLGISRRQIGFAGTKDRRAITTQWLAINAPMERVKEISLGDFEILEVYQSNKWVDLGDLIGNRFVIGIHEPNSRGEDLDSTIKEAQKQLSSLGGFPNFFGHQRFGALRPITHLVGKELIRGNFKGAVQMYLANPFEGESPDAFNARKTLMDTGDYKEALLNFPKNLNFELALLNHLVANPDDFVGALKSLPRNLLMMFVHAYQSYIFNRILSERIKKGLPLNKPLVGDIILPCDRNGLPDHKRWIMVKESNLEKIKKRVHLGKDFVSGAVYGSETEFAGGLQGEIEREVISSEKLQAKDFIIPELPVASSKGIRRELCAPVKDFKYEIEEENITLSFELNKGCYATSLLREFMKGDVLSY